MTQNKAFKAAVRARMATTGEPYAEARRKVIAEQDRPENRCKGCDNPFNENDRRPDGYAQHENSGYCRHCASREKT